MTVHTVNTRQETAEQTCASVFIQLKTMLQDEKSKYTRIWRFLFLQFPYKWKDAVRKLVIISTSIWQRHSNILHCDPERIRTNSDIIFMLCCQRLRLRYFCSKIIGGYMFWLGDSIYKKLQTIQIRSAFVHWWGLLCGTLWTYTAVIVRQLVFQWLQDLDSLNSCRN